MKKFKLVKSKGYFQSLRETKSVKELDDGAVEISGYASTKDKDRGGDVVEPKAFASALERYMTNPIVLLQHKAEKPIGIVEEADIDDNGLYIKAKISQNTDGVVDLIKNGVLRAFSIGYTVKDYETDVRELADGTYDMTNIIKDLELYEISVVSIPMNPYALSKSVEDLLEVEEADEVQESENESEESSENDEESVSEEKADDEVQEEQKNEDEIAVAVVDENTPQENENTEGTNVQPEEKVDENVSEATEETVEAIDGEIVEGEEVVEEESIEQKSEEIAHTEEVGAENEQNEADENSEISDEESNEEDSENDVETTSDDEVVDETSNNEVVETKSIETESQKQFDFESKIASLSKSFDEKLAEKDEKIKSLESKVETMTKLFAESLETIDSMMTAVKNTPVNAGLQYKRPLKKGGYYDIASIIKNL